MGTSMFTRQRSSSLAEAPEIRKFPLRRLQHTVDRFIKVLQIDIDRLGQHKYNIDKYTRYGDHRLLNREHINASRTVQQLKANLIELDRTRLQVDDNDVREYDKRTFRIREDAAKILREFIEQCSQEGVRMNRSPSGSVHESLPPSLRPSHDFEELPSSAEVSQMQTTADLESDYEAMLEAERSWQRLQGDLEDLNDVMKELARMVHEQGEALDSIEDNIEQGLTNVQEGNRQLVKASRFKTALYPLAGGVMGCAVGGPVGLVAGIKMGLAAAVGGSILGATSGRILKRLSRVDPEPDNIELKKVPSSQSCPTELNKL